MASPLMLITGASAGIGEAFAHLYAKNGWDLALVARREERLRGLQEQLTRDHDIEALVIPADLADPFAVTRIMQTLEKAGREVNGLINNAGFGPTGTFTDSDWAAHAAALEVMAVGPVRLAHAVLPGMKARDFGRIINVASVMGLVSATPGATLYGPVKAFLMRFSEALYQEARGTGVQVTALCPGLTMSEFHDHNGMREQVDDLPDFLWQTADEVAEQAYRANEDGRAVIITGIVNKAIVALHGALPGEVGRRVVASQAIKLRSAQK